MHVAEFIMNLNDLYKPALNQSQQSFYKEFLENYTPPQLNELWNETMRKHQVGSPPAIGKLSEYAKAVTPIKVINELDIQNELNWKRPDTEIFNTDLGRLALKQGWADSYRVYCRENGIPPQDDNTLLEFQKAKERADQAFHEIEHEKDNFSEALKNLRKSMMNKNRAYYLKYKKMEDFNLLD